MFFFRQRTGTLSLLLELQSALVRGSVVWMIPGEQPHILFSERIELPYKPHLGSSYLVKVTLKAIHEIIDVAQRQVYSLTKLDTGSNMPKAITDVHYILSSPWVLSQARTISTRFDRETAITEDRIHKILEGEREKVKGDGDGQLAAIEEKVFDVRLNGYSVSSWKGKEAKDLEISYALAVGSPDSVKRFRSACEHIARWNHVFFHSSLLLQYVGLKSLLAGDNEDCLLAHIHGELTDIVLVEHGSCAFFGSFPVGINTIVRKIAHASKTDEKTADSLLSLFLGKRLEESHATSIAPLMSDMTQAWMSELMKLMKTGAPDRAVPENIIIAARSHEDFFVRSLRSALPHPNVQVLSVDEFASKIVYDHLAYKPRLVSIYALGICDIM